MLFHRFGKIRDVKIIPEHTRNKSYGFVTFFSEADARRAIQVLFSKSWFYTAICIFDSIFKASVQNDSVMWGDRKLNVAPAIKRVNSNNHSSPVNNNLMSSTKQLINLIFQSSSSNGFYQPSRLANSPYYANSVPVPAANTMYTNTGVVSPADVQPQLDHGQVDSSNNAMYQSAMICRLPHQYAMVFLFNLVIFSQRNFFIFWIFKTQCHQYSSSSTGHYFVSPGFQPYVQVMDWAPPTLSIGVKLFEYSDWESNSSWSPSSALCFLCEHHGCAVDTSVLFSFSR